MSLFTRRAPRVAGAERLLSFQDWLATARGRDLCRAELAAIEKLVPRRYFPVAAQLGAPHCRVLDLVNGGRVVNVDQDRAGLSRHGREDAMEPPRGAMTVLSDFKSLPFAAHSVDFAVLPHTLDFVDEPHSLLRELTQVLQPDGYLMIVGFQPYSLWGLRACFTAPRWARRGLRALSPASRLAHGEPAAPWCGNFFSTRRIQDWLLLMGYRVRAGKILVYRPPLKHRGLLERIEFLERVGDRWWPAFGAVYVIVAQLETMRVIPLAARDRRRRLKPGLLPVTRRVGVVARRQR